MRWDDPREVSLMRPFQHQRGTVWVLDWGFASRLYGISSLGLRISKTTMLTLILDLLPSISMDALGSIGSSLGLTPLQRTISSRLYRAGACAFELSGSLRFGRSRKEDSEGSCKRPTRVL